MSKNYADVAVWSHAYGLWPGQALCLFANYSRWVHLSTNTLPFYNVFPRLENEFGRHLNIHGMSESPLNHWMHLHPNDDNEVWHLSQRLWRWLRWNDGTHVLLNDKSEAGWLYVPDRGVDPNTNTEHGEYIPEHVHHDWVHNQHLYSRDGERKLSEPGYFLKSGKFNNPDRY